MRQLIGKQRVQGLHAVAEAICSLDLAASASAERIQDVVQHSIAPCLDELLSRIQGRLAATPAALEHLDDDLRGPVQRLLMTNASTAKRGSGLSDSRRSASSATSANRKVPLSKVWRQLSSADSIHTCAHACALQAALNVEITGRCVF